MKRAWVWLILPILLAACTEYKDVPVREVNTCSNVVKVELVKRREVGLLEGPLPDDIYVKLTVADGRYFYEEARTYRKWVGKSLLETATKMEMGKEYCWTTYEPIE